VEAFANDGATTMTDLIFPSADSLELSAFAEDGEAELLSLTVFRVRNAADRSAKEGEPHGD